ncbi:F0F1 ATP synthase subunit B [Gynurincola endophyticus]|jgi:F-type H+-transporting ATPase subunit b|uniref:F0F1 ATP synthase subunit B n=1 Tax=Gynurincola endophyticus TaxID=2479004 RepID=UPI000F8D7E8A|nr:F0F1 ATP synthase subunit B [Gynurincola endophyticus]
MKLLTPDLGLFVWMLVAFSVVLVILAKFAWKPIVGALKERETGIADSLAQAEKVKAEMAQLQSDNEALLQKAQEERAQLLKEARDARDKMINEAKEQAKIEANKIIAEAQAAIQHQKNAAMTDVKNQVGNLVIEVATKVLGRELTNAGEQERFIQDLTKDIKLN